MRAQQDVRLFFALWPDQVIRDQISAYLGTVDLVHSRLVSASNFHVTLHFVGNVSYAKMHCLDLAAKQVVGESFTLTLDVCNVFKKPRVFWIGCNHVPPPLLELQFRLGEGLGQCGFVPEKRPFTPHLTLARKFTTETTRPVVEPIRWDINRFVLVESLSIENGVEYRVLESYSLGKC